jgi:hypothetical protein
MIVFLKLFLICSVAGCLAASLMWIFFWLVGVLEVPLTLKKLLGLAVSEKPKIARIGDFAALVAYHNSQAGTLPRLLRFESSPVFPPGRANSASTFGQWNHISDNQNMAQTHAYSAN